MEEEFLKQVKEIFKNSNVSSKRILIIEELSKLERYGRIIPNIDNIMHNLFYIEFALKIIKNNNKNQVVNFSIIKVDTGYLISFYI